MRASIKQIVLFLIVITFTTSVLFGQTPQLTSITHPSPNVQAMQKFGDIPVSPYTGVPNISVPIYTVQFRDVTLPLSLNYHASGIKVAEEASQVGLGWALNAGGTVSRNIVGQDDFKHYYFTTTVPDFDKSFIPTAYIVPNSCNLPVADYRQNGSGAGSYINLASSEYTPVTDLQPDQYYFSFAGKSGRFILKRDKTAVLETNEKLQITCAADGSSFSIVTEEGTKYDFTELETYNDGAEDHTTAWHLSKITSATGNIVTLTYNTPSNYVQPVGGYAETEDDWDAAVPLVIDYNASQASPFFTGPHYGLTPGQQFRQKVLNKIDFTNGVVQFDYSYNRQDLQYDGQLDDVQIFSKDKSGVQSATPFKKVVLSYDYFYCPNDEDYIVNNDKKRLKLTQVQTTGYYNGQTITENPYQFFYSEPAGLPAKTSFARDHWGYFNGMTSNGSLIPSAIRVQSLNAFNYYLGAVGPERNPNANFMQVFSLLSITYPTGGSTEFQYEANDFDETKSEKNDQAYNFQPISDLVPVDQSLKFDAVTQTYRDGGGSGHNLIDMTSEYYNPDPYAQNVPISIEVTYRYNNTDCSRGANGFGINEGQIYCILNGPAGDPNPLNVKFDLADYHVCSDPTNDQCVTNGGCTAYIKDYSATAKPGIYTFTAVAPTSGFEEITMAIHWYTTSTTTNASGVSSVPITTAGGLRIKKIIDHDAVSSANDKVRKYIYHYWEDRNNDGTNEEYSYGIRMACPRYSYFDMGLDYVPAFFANGCTATAYYTAHLMRSSDSNNPLNGSAGGSVVGYDQVTELFGENGENGKKVYQYINDPDVIVAFPDPFSHSGLPLRPPSGSTRPNPFNGTLKHETDYSNVSGAFKKITETVNAYGTPSVNDFSDAIENRIMPINAHGASGATCGIQSSSACGNNLLFAYQCLSSQWNPLLSTDVKMYDANDETQYTETKTTYTYDNNTLLPSVTQVNNSKGELVTTNIKYPLNYTPGTATDAFTNGIKNLQTKHIINAPVEVYTQKSDYDGTNTSNTRTVGSVLTSYNSSLPTPALIYQSQSSAPLTTFTPASINSSGLVKDGSYKPVINFDSYDAANGNLLQQHKQTDINLSYIWDYKSSYPIAEIKNAVQNNTAYTSFEWDGTGNWTIPSSARDYTNSITGKASYNLSNGSVVMSGLDATKTYTMSLWAPSGTVAQCNGHYIQIYGQHKGWGLYMWPVSGTTTCTISGSGIIDELRLYPADAQMSTYTYDPLIGMTSQCDAAGHITYYEYDGLARLKLIRDLDGNILKKFDYHYTGQADNSPTCATCDANGGAAAGKKCINGVCEQGKRVNVGTSKLSDGTWKCGYKYKWSDGSVSAVQYEINTDPCIVN